MSKLSVGTIIKCEDQLVADEIEHLLRNHEGCQVIYFTRNDTHNLYVVSSERAKRVFTGDYHE